MTFWEDSHNRNDTRWLTGTTLEDIKKYHRLPKITSFLEIGVGTGSLSQELKAEPYIIADVTWIALNRINAHIKLLSKDLKYAPPVKFALCHLVFQHCEEDEVERIINDVQLTKDGIFSFQIAVLTKKHGGENGPLYFTTLDKTLDLIDRTNKKFVSSARFEHPGIDWYIIRVK